MHKFIMIFLIANLSLSYANNDPNAYLQTKINGHQFDKKMNKNQSQQGSFVVVGGDPNGCHFSNIQDAIDAAKNGGETEIRIATNKIYTENLAIDDFSVSLIGGYDDCLDAGLPFGPSSDYAEVYGSDDSLPVLIIFGNSERHNIEIKNMKFTGDGISSTLDGGIRLTNANAHVKIDNTRINFNSAVVGGGLSIIGGNADVELTSTLIDFNTAQVGGGGIYCAGHQASIVLGKQSSVDTNTSTFDASSIGGGVYVNSGCNLILFSSKVKKNNASFNGGGIYASGGAEVTMIGYEVCSDVNCFGDNLNPVQLSENNANHNSSTQGEGGAIYATGVDTVVTIAEAIIEGNSAYNGGAISASFGADLFLQAPSEHCIKLLGTQSRRCNLFRSNSADNSGGAIYNNGALMEVSQFTFERNRANFGIAIYAINDDSYVGVTASNFIRNGDGGEINGDGEFLDFYVIRAADSIIELNHTTFAENEAVDAVFGVATTPNSHLNVVNSIIYDALSGPVLNNGAGSTFFKCIVAHESDSITGSEIIVADPMFRDIEIGDFHINAQLSPAVDMCQDISGNGFIDIDTQTGGFDDPSRPNFNNNPDNRFDAGSDETYDNDMIFEDGFDPLDSP
ncbi:MAG: hypothetical protein AB8B80_09390 [Marinicellaceae bacterium]